MFEIDHKVAQLTLEAVFEIETFQGRLPYHWSREYPTQSERTKGIKQF